MVHLTLAGVSEDGKRLLMVDDAGVEHDLDVDARLRAALRGETSRLGQLEMTMDSVLRPRDIQARIRAGESPEAVAEAAQTSVDKIMPYAGPVLAEREHVAQRAQRSSVRRTAGADGVRSLGEAVEAHLRSEHIGPDVVTWDAWRREDGRWTLTAEFETRPRSGLAHFTYDMPGSYVLLDDEDARWLVGEVIATATLAAPLDDLQQARARRRVSLDDEELPLGEDAIGMVSPEPEPEPAPDPEPEPEPAPVAETEPEPETEPEVQPEPPVRRPVRKSRGRASVPSWDEIMFGGGKQE
ncbi:septation protein SepH [Nocardioides salarius]|uniref:septation protein SepH n=1 Tax=Nocardioides salarius TaxID=374513 RepID=UPI001D0D59B9|nr:septation protein SepH [Nocardioides salarius]